MDQRIFFTSDFHWNHSNIAGPKVSKWPRGYRNFKDVRQMNETIINRYNERVGPNDITYFLGDLYLGQANQFTNLFFRLNNAKNKNIHLLRGNHDKVASKFPDLFASVNDYLEIQIEKQNIVLFHYLILSWRGMHRGSWQLAGHSHGNCKLHPEARQMDVGVDTNNFYPYEFAEIKEIMKSKRGKSYDHHI